MSQKRKSTTAIPADIWVMVVAAFIVAIGYGIIAPVLPQFAQSFHVGETAAAVVVSAFAFFRLVSAPAGGALINRLGERPIYVTGLLIVAVSTYAVAFAQTYWQLLIFRGLGGLGSTMFTVSAMAIIVKLAPPNARARATGLYATAFLVGNIAGPIVGGLLAGFGLKVPFIIYGTGLVVAAGVVHFKLANSSRVAHAENKTTQKTPADDTSEADSESSEPADSPLAPMKVREAWRVPAYRSALLGGMVSGWSAMGIRIAIYPMFALSVLHVGPGAAGLALTFFALGNAMAISVSSRMADVHGRVPFVASGFAVMGIATILLGVWPNLAMFLILSTIAGMGAGLLMPAQQAAIADVIGSERPGGKVLSRFQMAMDFGSILGPIATAALAQHVSYAVGFAVAGAFCLIASFAWMRTPEPMRTPPKAVTES